MHTFKRYLMETHVDSRAAEVEAARDMLNRVAREVASRFTDFERFKRAVVKQLPGVESKPGGVVVIPNETGPIHVDLNAIYTTHNQDQKAKSDASWDDYGKRRDAKDPSIVSPDGWTGD